MEHSSGFIKPESYRYWAFISYSDKDKSWARWLLRAIETYAIPTQFINHPTPSGHPAPKRFHPIFRDRDELPASCDLGAQIEEALRVSRYLIVICSPHAAQSQWVNKEIETFFKWGRRDRVLAVIVDGEPLQGHLRACFPPLLRQFEPLAADARPEDDGKLNAKLKLLSGMLGVNFDALKQRDSVRQIRHLQRLLAGVLVLVLILSALTWYANTQRQRATEARNHTEEILEFLLYDMDDVLRGVGRLDIVEKIQKQVDAYNQKFGYKNANEQSLQNRIFASFNIGDFLVSQGDLQGALVVYKMGQEIAKNLTQKYPGNIGWQRALSVSYNKIGDIQRDQENLAGALASYTVVLKIAEELSHKYPENAGWQKDRVVSHYKLALLYQKITKKVSFTGQNASNVCGP